MSEASDTVTVCPICELEIDPTPTDDNGALEVGDVFECEGCGCDLLVTGLDPLELTDDDDEEGYG